MTPPRNRVTPNDFNNALLAKISTRPQGAGTKKAAFTLAEVLITLGIIGIVAAMTLPTLIQNYQKKVIQNQLKKNYAILQNWVEQAETREELPMSKWQTSLTGAKDYFDTYIQPYFSEIKKCSNMKACGYKDIGTKSGKWAGTSTTSIRSDNSRVLFKIKDGTVIFLMLSGGNSNGQQIKYNTVWIDVNGTAAPNTYCQDVFIFTKGTDKGLAPSGCTLQLFENNWEFPKNYTYW
jgi:prepilin-type N-terminal cleavage/methylation domain-containing protein